jgi:hypothetical protein
MGSSRLEPRASCPSSLRRSLVITLRDEFLSDEDLDLRSMTEAELFAYWDMWLRQAQATNDLDQHTYSHGVFRSAPEAAVDVTQESEPV